MTYDPEKYVTTVLDWLPIEATYYAGFMRKRHNIWVFVLGDWYLVEVSL